MDKQKTLYSENRFLKKEFFKYLQIAFGIGMLYSAGSSKPTSQVAINPAAAAVSNPIK